MPDPEQRQHRKRLWLSITGLGVVTAIVAYQLYKKYYAGNSNTPRTLPGPKPSDVKLGNFGDMNQAGSLHQYLERLSREYGPIGAFYWGTTRVAYITSQRILLHPHNKRALSRIDHRPPFLFDAFKPLITEHSIQYKNGHEFKAKYNHVYLAAFQRAMSQKIGIFALHAQTQIDEWSQLLDKNDGDYQDKDAPTLVNVSTQMFEFAAKVIMSVMFGNVSRKESAADVFIAAYNEAWKEMELRLVKGLASDAVRGEKFQHSLDTMRQFILSMLREQAEASTSTEGSLFIDKLKQQQSAWYDTDDKMVGECVTAMVGGAHTSKAALTWLMYFISTHCNVQQRMYAEIRSVFDVSVALHTLDAKLVGAQLKQLTYCKQVITETLRLSALAPWSARCNHESDMRLVVSDAEGNERMVCLPKGMAYIIGQGVALRDPDVFEAPHKFIPERWSRSSLKQNKLLQQSQDAIFGGVGGRVCPGLNLFRNEALVYVVCMLCRFRFEMKDKEPMQTEYGLVSNPDKDVIVQIFKRA